MFPVRHSQGPNAIIVLEQEELGDDGIEFQIMPTVGTVKQILLARQFALTAGELFSRKFVFLKSISILK